MSQAKLRRQKQIRDGQLTIENGLLSGHYLSRNKKRLLKQGKFDYTVFSFAFLVIVFKNVFC